MLFTEFLSLAKFLYLIKTNETITKSNFIKEMKFYDTTAAYIQPIQLYKLGLILRPHLNPLPKQASGAGW